jgi:hypothetical protein
MGEAGLLRLASAKTKDYPKFVASQENLLDGIAWLIGQESQWISLPKICQNVLEYNQERMGETVDASKIQPENKAF